MFINYDVILQKKSEIDSKAEARQYSLQSDAEEFINQLKVSLQLPVGNAIDINGRPLSHIVIGVKNNLGLFQQSALSSLKVNENHVLCFLTNLLVNSQVPGGEWISIPVELWYQRGRLNFSCGRVRNHIEIQPSPSPNRFLDATDDFKKKCIAELDDPNLE